MGWLSLLKLLLSLGVKIAEIVRNKSLMDAGEAKAIARALEKQHGRVQKALDARRARPGDESADDDGFRRD